METTEISSWFRGGAQASTQSIDRDLVLHYRLQDLRRACPSPADSSKGSGGSVPKRL